MLSIIINYCHEALGSSVRPTCLLFEVKKKLLVEDEGHSADLLHLGLRRGVPVDEVGRDGDRQLASELFSFKTWKDTSVKRVKMETLD